MSEQAFTITIKPAEASQLEMLDPFSKTRWYGSLLPSLRPPPSKERGVPVAHPTFPCSPSGKQGSWWG